MASRMVLLPEPVAPLIRNNGSVASGAESNDIVASPIEAIFFISSFMNFILVAFIGYIVLSQDQTSEEDKNKPFPSYPV